VNNWPFVIRSSPHPKAQARPLTLEMLQVREHTSTPFPSIVFTFGFAIESIKEFGSASMVYLACSLENKKSFFTLIFLKSKLCNKLTIHLHLLCTCLHKNSTFYKIPHMQNALSSGKNHNTNIVMMVGQHDLCNCWVNLCKCICFCIYCC